MPSLLNNNVFLVYQPHTHTTSAPCKQSKLFSPTIGNLQLFFWSFLSSFFNCDSNNSWLFDRYFSPWSVSKVQMLEDAFESVSLVMSYFLHGRKFHLHEPYRLNGANTNHILRVQTTYNAIQPIMQYSLQEQLVPCYSKIT